MACDVSLVAFSADGNSVALPAHKYVLISRNPVFRAMFCGPLADKSDTIHLTDVSSEALHELLRYLHVHQLKVHSHGATECFICEHSHTAVLRISKFVRSDRKHM